MKFVLNRLQVGDSLKGTVAEQLPDGELIINIHGDLIRVANKSARKLKPGDPVSLIVRAVQPPRFQLLSERSEQRRRGRIDVSV